MSIFKIRAGMSCEYIAQGHSNKHTLVNVYGGHVLVKEFPSTFPVAFYFEILSEIEPGIPVTLEIQLDKASLAQAVSVLPPLPEDSDSFVIALPALPVTVEGPCELRVVASAEGHRKMTMLTLGIREGTRAT